MDRTEVRKRGATFRMLALLGSYPQLVCMLGAGVLCTVRDLACAVTLAHATDVLLEGEGEIFSALEWSLDHELWVTEVFLQIRGIQR